MGLLGTVAIQSTTTTAVQQNAIRRQMQEMQFAQDSQEIIDQSRMESEDSRAASDPNQELQKLFVLKQHGFLTEAEFAKLKAQVLSPK